VTGVGSGPGSQAVREVLGEVLGGDVAASISDDDLLFERMLVDSLSLITIVSSLESRFGIEVAAEDLVPENFESIAAIAEFVAASKR
jgi:acyl carrier protein